MILERFSKNAAANQKKDEQVIVALAQWCDKVAGLIGVDLASRFHGSIAEMGPLVWNGASWSNDIIWGGGGE